MSKIAPALRGLDRSLKRLGIHNHALVALVLPQDGTKLLAAAKSEGLEATPTKAARDWKAVMIEGVEITWPLK